MLMAVWSGAAEAKGDCPGLSTYNGKHSSLRSMIDEGDGLRSGEAGRLTYAPRGQFQRWGVRPRLSARVRQRILKHLRAGQSVRWIARTLHTSAKTIRRVRQGAVNG